MKVTIITATLNSAGTIKDTLLSIKQQSYKNIEHIIVDGASSDNTLKIINNLSHKGPVLSEADNGIYDAMNKGVKMAKGDIIGILNSDDYYPDPAIIDEVVKTFRSGDCDAIYGDLIFVDQGEGKKVVRKWVAGVFNRNHFYNGWMPPHPTFFVKKEVYEKYGYFNLKFKNSSDYELLLRFMFLHRIKVKYIPTVMVHMRVGGHSNRSLKNRLVAHKEDYLAWKANGISPKWFTLALKPIRKIKQFVSVNPNTYTYQFPVSSVKQLATPQKTDPTITAISLLKTLSYFLPL